MSRHGPARPLARRPLATAFGGDLRSGHNCGFAYGEVSLASLGAFPLAFCGSFDKVIRVFRAKSATVRTAALSTILILSTLTDSKTVAGSEGKCAERDSPAP